MARPISLYVRDADGATIIDPLFEKARSLRKGSQYPAGLYGTATFTLPRDPGSRPSRLALGHEVRISVWVDDYYLAENIYHGKVESLEEIKRGGVMETRVTCVGAWGYIMETRGVEKRWADTRIGSDVWVRDEAASGAELATDDRDNRIRVTPKGVAWGATNVYALEYTMPTGETIGRVENNFDFQEPAGDWTWRLYDAVGAAAIWTKSASATGAEANSLGTPRQSLELQFLSNASQTPVEDGTYYGEVDTLIVYASRNHASATLGTVNVYQIALDIIDLLGVDETLISATLAELDSSLTLSLVPFITDGFESFASILARAAGYGNTGSRPVGFGLRPPFHAPDNLPPLFLEAYPVFSDHDYYISSDDCDLSVRANLDDVWNWIVVEYTDAEDRTITITPDDDADLTDATSVDLYGKRVRRLVLPLSNPTQAKSFGARYLDRHKDPTYAVTRPLQVSRLQAKNGGWVPAAQIDAGKRLWVTDLPNLTAQEIPSGVVFLIVATEYDHDRGVVNLSLGGYPDNLAMILARMELLPQ